MPASVMLDFDRYPLVKGIPIKERAAIVKQSVVIGSCFAMPLIFFKEIFLSCSKIIPQAKNSVILAKA